MTSLQEDLGRQNIDKHIELLAGIYNVSPKNVADCKLCYDLIIPAHATDIPVECKTCYAKTGNIAVEYVAALRCEYTEIHFGQRFRRSKKFERFGPGQKEHAILQSIVRDVYNGSIYNNKMGLTLSAVRPYFPPNHSFSYIRPNLGYWLFCDSRNLVKFMKKNNIFREGEMFITYTEEFDYNTIGALLPLEDIEKYDQEVDASDRVILVKKGI